MSLSDLASLGSFVTGVAILFSFVFLALQLRQSNANQRALMNQGIIGRTFENQRWLSEPHMAELQSRISAGDTEFTPLELQQLSTILRTAVLGAQDAYTHHRAGLADEMVLESSLAVLRRILGYPVYRAIWNMRRSMYAREWQVHIDQFIGETPIASPSDTVRVFKDELAAVVS